MTSSYPTGSSGASDSTMPSGAPGIVPRRSSYASVVSGTASHSYNQPTRSGAFSTLLYQPNDHSYDSNHQSGHGRYDPRINDMDFTANGAMSGQAGSWSRGGQLPNSSSGFSSLINGGGNIQGGNRPWQFFTPAYLQGSRYMQRLEEAHKAKLQAQRDGPSAPSSQPGSLSTSASSLNLHSKSMPSHRGMTYDLIEKAPPVDDEALSPLPSRWSNQDKHPSLELFLDGQDVKFSAPKAERERDHEACAIRANHPMPPQCGIYYYEVEIISKKREECSIGIGFSTKSVPLTRLPGWEPDSWAYHGDDGHSYCAQNSGKSFGPPFVGGDVIGCGVNFRTGSAFFTKNGDLLGTPFQNIKGRLFPSIGMKKTGEHIRVNFGQRKFIYDIGLMMTRERARIRQEIEVASTDILAQPWNETGLIQSLVIQFLTHEGYVETARAFASEVQSEKQALNLDPDIVIEGFNVREDEDAGHRQRIRAAVLDGDIESALKNTNEYYPHVLKDNENVYFRLRCRRFIEMIRQGAEMQRAPVETSKKSNGHSGDWYDDIINRDMDLDDSPSHGNDNWDKMDTEESSDNQLDYTQLIQDTILYGQNLQAEFKDDPRREINKALSDAFALLAYQDPLSEKEVSHRLDIGGRISVAEELNSAILLSLGKSSSAALEQLIQQTTVLLEDLQEDGGPGSLVNISDFVRPKDRHSIYYQN